MDSINEQVIELIQRETSGDPVESIVGDISDLIETLSIYQESLEKIG